MRGGGLRAPVEAKTRPRASRSCSRSGAPSGASASRLAVVHVDRIFGELWRPLRGVRRARQQPRLQPPGSPCTPSSPGLPRPARPPALRSKRPTRVRGAADEWTFRFPVWHRLAHPGGGNGRGEKSLSGVGSQLGSAGSQNSHLPRLYSASWGTSTGLQACGRWLGKS